MHAHPRDRLAGLVAVAHQLEPRAVGLDQRVAVHARLRRRDRGVGGLLDRVVAVAAVHAHVTGVQLVAERDRLLRAVADVRELRREVVPDPADGAGEGERPEYAAASGIMLVQRGKMAGTSVHPLVAPCLGLHPVGRSPRLRRFRFIVIKRIQRRLAEPSPNGASRWLVYKRRNTTRTLVSARTLTALRAGAQQRRVSARHPYVSVRIACPAPRTYPRRRGATRRVTCCRCLQPVACGPRRACMHNVPDVQVSGFDGAASGCQRGEKVLM
jgi:hypothetical protein